MGKNSAIPWCDHTFNPWIGCTKVSPGCENCYAEVMNKRFKWNPEGWGKGKPRKRTSAANWSKPIKWNKEAGHNGTRPRVFCGSLCDIFDNEVPVDWRLALLGLIYCTPNLEWLLLTKRIDSVERINWVDKGWWPEKVRLGITVCNQEEADRDISKLLKLGVPNFLSIEPMLGPILLDNGESSYLTCNGNNISGMSDDLHCCESYDTHGFHFHGVDWIIVGGESGPNASPMKLSWVRSIIDQCKTASVPLFVKQLGSKWAKYQEPGGDWHTTVKQRGDTKGADMQYWPEELQIREFPE